MRTDWLPLRHVRPIHGSNLDTASIARIDSVRAIEVAFRVTDGQPAPRTRTFEMRRAITLPNAGKEVKKTCGDGPILTSAAGFAAKDTTDAGATHFAVLRWNASPDDGSGEKDVVRYVLWRSTTPFAFGTFGDPYLSVVAGSATYEYFDQAMWSRGLRSDREGFALCWSWWSCSRSPAWSRAPRSSGHRRSP